VARRAGTRPSKLALRTDSLPIWSCSVWGLPCPLHCCSGGALLPHLFTLTPALPPGRYVFCGTSRQPTLKSASRTLSGTLLYGVRTFLPHFLTKRERPSGPAAYIVIICEGDVEPRGTRWLDSRRRLSTSGFINRVGRTFFSHTKDCRRRFRSDGILIP